MHGSEYACMYRTSPSNVQVHALIWSSPLILASNSPRRRELLHAAGIDAIKVSPNVDDSVFSCGTMPVKEWVTTLAILKARSVCRSYESSRGTVLAADTVCVVGGQLLGQPVDEAMARDMVLSMKNRTHEVHTGWCLKSLGGKRTVHGCETTLVTIGEIDTKELDIYMDSGLWRGKAGGYNLGERLHAGWPLTWEGDPTNVMGLPMDRLVAELSRK